MAPSNPYFICIDLRWPDMTRPTQNQIARVNAYEVYGTKTWEGQSGYNPANGEWQAVYMQNIDLFAAREQPTLCFEVVDTTEKIVYTSPAPYQTYASGSTVQIIIGQTTQCVPDDWKVHGKVLNADNSPVKTGTVAAVDVTNGREQPLRTGPVSPTDGSYSISYKTSDFSGNDIPHSEPNLQVFAYDNGGTLIGKSVLLDDAPRDCTLNVQLGATPQPGKYLVYGTVKNTLGLPVSGIAIAAKHVAWTSAGIVELPLGTDTSDGAGKYEISYVRPAPSSSSCPCSTPVDQINLLVTATGKDDKNNDVILDTVGVLVNVPAVQEADLVVNRPANSTDSEYQELQAKLEPCLALLIEKVASPARNRRHHWDGIPA